MINDEQTWTLKEIDEQQGVVKGTAFRAFKSINHALIENVDYFYINGDQQPRQIHELKQSQRLYLSSQHALIFTKNAQQKIIQAILFITD